MSVTDTEPASVEVDDQLLAVLETVDEQVQAMPEPTPMRPLGIGVLAGGLACLLLPGTLARFVGSPLARLLGLSVETGDTTGMRLRLLGFALVAAGAHLAYHSSVRPDGFTA